MTLELSQFTVQRASFEIRYSDAFLLWDRAGTIWHEIGQNHPEMKIKNAHPNNTVVRFHQNAEGVVAIDKAFIIVLLPSTDLSELVAVAKAFFPIVIEQLEIENLTRIGLRIFYEKEFSDRSLAAKFVRDHVTAVRQIDKKLAKEGNILDPEFALRWEGEAIGWQLRVKSFERTLNIDIPMEFRGADPANEIKLTTAQLDIDYYAHGKTPRARFDATSLIQAWRQVILKDVVSLIDD